MFLRSTIQNLIVFVCVVLSLKKKKKSELNTKIDGIVSATGSAKTVSLKPSVPSAGTHCLISAEGEVY